MRGVLALACAVALGAVVSCGARADPADAPAPEEPTAGAGTARILLVGDVMLGRQVGRVVAHDPSTVFELLRPVVSGADLALANLESPLTTRPHLVGPHDLRADPTRAASLLAGAGFDAVGVANNHAGDAGPETVADTLAALYAAGVVAIGGGVDAAAAWQPVVFDLNGVGVAVLAVDATGGGPPAGDGSGVASWDADRVEEAVRQARAEADVVIVGLHGGVEYLPRPDPAMRHRVEQLTEWGADVVWGSGAHVRQPVTVSSTPQGNPSIQAPSLGNALFDQGLPGTSEGLVVEVLVGSDGVIAHRVGTVASHLRAVFQGWDPPEGDAVAIEADWWTLDRPVDPASLAVPEPVSGVVGLFAEATVVSAARGDVTGDGIPDIVASYRRPYFERLLHRAYPDTEFADALGRTAHLSVFEPTGRMIWGAGTLTAPVAAFAICDGSLALAFSTLDRTDAVAGGAWVWRPFGFTTAEVLDGFATPACSDIDRDGHTDPILIDRRPAPG